MKFSKMSQLFAVSAVGLAAALLLSACNLVSIDYVFVANSAGNTTGSAGQITTYAADGYSGALRNVASTAKSGGTAPVSIAVTPDETNLYVANHGNNTVVHFIINEDGSLSQKDSVTLPTAPVYLAVNGSGTYLYVVSGTSSATLTEYPLSSGAIGAAAGSATLSLPGFAGDTLISTGVTALANNSKVYVTVYDQSAYNPGGTTTSSANPGWVFGFNVGTGGALTAAAGSPYQAGVKPSAVLGDPTSRFVYVTDYASNDIIGYTVQSSGVLSFIVSGPFKTGGEPSALAIDPRGLYIYVANSLDSSVNAYSITLQTGAPSAVVNTAASTTLNPTDTQPVSIVVEPGLGRFVYTANYLGNSVSGFKLVPNTGALGQTQATPYPTGALPSALAVVPHGNHAVQVTTP